MTEDRATFRYAIGALVLIGGLAGFAALIAFPIPAGNRDAVVLALGLVLGWGSTVVGYEFGSSPAGRRAADVALKQVETPPATGKPDDPVHIADDAPPR